MKSKQIVWLLVSGIIFFASTVLAISLTINPLSTTRVAHSSDEATASICPDGDGTNVKINQMAIPYIVQNGFTKSIVCNSRIDTLTYQQTTPYEIYALSVLSLAATIYQIKKHTGR